MIFQRFLIELFRISVTSWRDPSEHLKGIYQILKGFLWNTQDAPMKSYWESMKSLIRDPWGHLWNLEGIPMQSSRTCLKSLWDPCEIIEEVHVVSSRNEPLEQNSWNSLEILVKSSGISMTSPRVPMKKWKTLLFIYS